MGIERISSIFALEWVYVLVVLALLVLVVLLTMVVLRGAVKKFLNKQYIKKDKSIHRAEGIFILVMTLIGVDVVFQKFLVVDNVLFRALHTIIVFLFTLFIIEIAHFLLEVWGSHMTKRKGIQFQEEILPVTHSVVKIVLALIGFIVILQVWGVQIWTLLASIGIVGIILGLALKDSLEDVFGGISLIMDRTFKAGDVIQLETGDIGEVVMINLRSTRILTHEEKIVTIPNGILANAKIMNYSQPTNLLRVDILFNVAYGSDPLKVAKVVCEEALCIKDVLHQPAPDVKMAKMGEYGLEFRLEVFTRFRSIRDLEDLKDDLTTRTYLTLRKHKIIIPYPMKVSYSVPLHGKEAKEMKKLL
jgi:MscS family membrane protein